MKRGFTLLEVLVAVSIIGILGIVVTQVFFSTFRANTKTEILKEVKQNGVFALETMTRMIQAAQMVTSACSAAGTTSGSVTIVNADSGTTTFGCGVDGGVTRIASTSSSVEYLTSNNVSLGGTTCAEGSLAFTCTASAGIPTLIKIAFTIAQKGTPVDSFEKDSAAFQTSVLLRNEE